MKVFLNAWTGRYDDKKYPKEFYFDSLNKIRQADTPEVLAEGIIGMLHWKDGKVRRSDGKGLFCLNEKHYILSRPKPNTYLSERHNNVLGSYKFYDWAKTEVVGKGFNILHLKKITSRGFQLWKDNSLVIPTFLLHILAPSVYPIYDQHVERAKRVLMGQSDRLHSPLTLNDYISYKDLFDFWLKDMFETEDATLEQRKLLDEALWAFGKSLKNQADYYVKVVDNEIHDTKPLNDGNLINYIPDSEFKKRVMSYAKQGFTQLEAMKRVSEEYGVKLKDSYYRYPGSHINRWGKQALGE